MKTFETVDYFSDAELISRSVPVLRPPEGSVPGASGRSSGRRLRHRT